MTILKFLAGFLAAGLVAGVAWLILADPARWEVTSEGTILTEAGAKGRFGVIVTFVVVSAGAAFVWGYVSGLPLRNRGWLMVPLFVGAALVAGVIAWQVGVQFGPPDPATVQGKVGDTIPQELAIDTFAPFMVWPIFALVGLFLAVYSSSDGRPEGASHRDEVVGR